MTKPAKKKFELKLVSPVLLSMLVAVSICISGCEQAPGVVIHEPGVYKGGVDTLQTDTAALNERAKQQMDR